VIFQKEGFCGCKVRRKESIKISNYRKPTFTDTTIPYTSNHPPQHKYAAVRFLYNRLNPYQLHRDEYEQEDNIIQNILHNNSFPIRPQKSSTHRHKHTASPPTPNLKWATFTYTGRETTYITNVFKHSNIKIAFHTRNSILSHLTNHTHTHRNQYSSSGFYKLPCPDCNKAYIGQTDRNFSIRFNEHKNAFRNNSPSPNFAKHLNEHAHSFGTISTTMQTIQNQKKGSHLNNFEQCYIHKEAASNNHLNDNHTIFHNKIFETILKIQLPHHPTT
jgi:hypothetical protein